MKLSNISKYKSTTLGLILLVFAGYIFITKHTTDVWVLGAISFVGLSLFFTGDGFINNLQKLVFELLGVKIDNEKKKEDDAK
ncbi:hypothetical protein WBG78_28370 [Chryseolinea sp. T2]|uniref:hypothetical protein n=1 Tax=Chryseolinea sp. T2 TaxID=3129255 RepID=UPI00307761BE